MTRQDAQRKLERLFPGARVRLEAEQWSTGPSSPERRAEAETAYQKVSAEYDAAKAEYDRIVREHSELQRLAALQRELFAERKRLNHERHYRRFGALKNIGSIGWEYIGMADSWEEIIERASAAAAEKKKVAR